MSSRPFDVALALVGLHLFGPLMLVAAALVRLEDGGPALFRQRRVGRGGRPFDVLKLRTMADGRETTVGRWLRPTGIDEMPQFLNVLAGQMSIVGPRPLTLADVDRLASCDPAFADRFEVLPGITGLAQVHGTRSARHCHQLERLYARRCSLKTDAKLLVATLAINVLGRARFRAVLRRVRRFRGRNKR